MLKKTLNNLKVSSLSTSCTEITSALSNGDQLLLVTAAEPHIANPVRIYVVECDGGALVHMDVPLLEKKRVESLVERRAEWRQERVQSKSETIHTVEGEVIQGLLSP
jgi:hypothetical protein